MRRREISAEQASRVARGGERGGGHSIVILAAAAYGAQPDAESTVPTGFDPHAAALFECIVEAAYLVACADGVFDEQEQAAFERVVVSLAGGAVAPPQVAALVGDLADSLAEDGIDRRLQRIGETIQKTEHGEEVLRVAALLAQASNDVSSTERAVLARLAAVLGRDSAAIERALGEAAGVLDSRPT